MGQHEFDPRADLFFSFCFWERIKDLIFLSCFNFVCFTISYSQIFLTSLFFFEFGES
jgi:hypothetical protein